MAILKEGALQASGSPAFLKKHFGLGYNLSLVISPTRQRGEPRTSALMAVDATEFESKKNRVRQFLANTIPDIQVARTLGSEVIFRVPNGSEDRLPGALATLDLNRRSLGVGAFGIENSSLAEVVLVLSEDQEKNDAIPHNTTESTDDETGCSTITRGAGSVIVEPSPSSFLKPKYSRGNFEPLTWLQQVGLLYSKRFTVQRRDWKGLFFFVVAPTLVVALVLLILTINLSISGPAIEMSLSTLAVGSDKTDVLVGGGAALRSRLTAKKDIAEQYEELRSVLQPLYKNAQFHHLSNILSSSDMSGYLMQSYDDYNGSVRYGSFVLRDIVDLVVTIDWPFYEDDLKRLVNNSLDMFTEAEIDLEANEMLVNAIYNLTGVDLGFMGIGVSP